MATSAWHSPRAPGHPRLWAVASFGAGTAPQTRTPGAVQTGRSELMQLGSRLHFLHHGIERESGRDHHPVHQAPIAAPWGLGRRRPSAQRPGRLRSRICPVVQGGRRFPVATCADARLARTRGCGHAGLLVSGPHRRPQLRMLCQKCRPSGWKRSFQGQRSIGHPGRDNSLGIEGRNASRTSALQ